jgi:heptaprenyl diphosphate synthase
MNLKIYIEYDYEMIDESGEARVISLQDIRKQLAEMKELVEQKVFHSYLFKFIQTPYIDEDKLLILISILNKIEMSNMKAQNYCLTTMLIQIALDTHENVPNETISDLEEESQKNKQLTVLAGDYFSGLYYKLLAETDDIQMINVLSKGIKVVNEHKISVFQQEFDAIEKLMSSIKMIESSLIIKFIEYFKVDFWKEAVIHFLFIKRLLHEKKQYLETRNSLLFEGLKKFTFPKNEVPLGELSNEQQKFLLLICDRYIDFSKQAMENGLKQIPCVNSLLDETITTVLHEHHPVAKTFVEEG